MAPFLTLNPWTEKGIPLERQYRSWKQIVKEPYRKQEIEAYSRARIILMNGIEAEAGLYSHSFARMTDNLELKTLLARTRRVEDQQQTTINWLNPGDQTILETTLGYEQVAVDLTAYLARHEPDPYVREALHFGLLEDFDHLYRYSELLDYLEGTDPNTVLQGKTDILPGRPTEVHHNDPKMRLLRHYEKNRAQPDPTETPLERQVLHELMEVYNYLHCFEQEADPRLKQIWDEFLHMEVTHVQLWGEMLNKYEGIEPEVLFGTELSVEFKFQENKEYVRGVLEQQRDLREIGERWVMKDDLPKNWPSFAYQKIVNAEGNPSEEIIQEQASRHNGTAQHPGDELLARARELAEQFSRTPKGRDN